MDELVGLKFESEDGFDVRFQVIPFEEKTESLDVKRRIIEQGLKSVDNELDDLEDYLSQLNNELDKLTNHADGIDYIVAVGSGILSGIIDILFVDDLSIEKANEWGNKKTENFVVKIAQKQGYQGDDLYGAVKFLEGKYPIAADKATNDMGGGLQHHLRDYSHHPTPVGLLFSLLTQFTEKVYGTDVTGRFVIVPLDESALKLIGKDFPEKVTFGVINWFFHMVSDIAGSSTAIAQGKTGTGLPGPILSLLKEISSLPIFKKLDSRGYKEFSVWISKLFNGTLLAERDANGKIVKSVKFDFRTELGIAHQLSQQAIPVIINECLVRGFYFIRRLITEIKDKDISGIKELKKLDWRKVLPFKNRTVIRMLTISTGTMTAIDLADAAIESAVKSGGVTNPAFLRNMIVKVNFVGIGRFAIAVGADVSMGLKRRAAERERKKVITQIICTSNTKIYYLNADIACDYSQLYANEAEMAKAEADLWKEIGKNDQAIAELYEQVYRVGAFYAYSIREMDKSFDRIEKLLPGIEESNPGLVDAMLRRIKR